MVRDLDPSEELAFPCIEPTQCCYPRRLQVFPRAQQHTHPYFELAFAFEDGTELDYPADRKRVRLPKDYWILTPPETPHAEVFTNRRNPVLGWLGFSVPDGTDLAKQLRSRCFKAHRCATGGDHPNAIMQEILREQEYASLYWREKRQLALRRLMICLLRDEHEADAAKPASVDRVIAPWIGRAPAYIDSAAYFLSEQYSRPLAVNEVAQFYGTTVAHFVRMFRRRYKMTPKEFQMEARNEKIKSMLANGDDDLLSIAVQCGFHDASHLSRFFKKRNGTTPGEYRDAARASAKAKDRPHMRKARGAS